MSKDVLARGGRSATFLPATKVTQAKWDAMWECDHVTEKQAEDENPYETDNYVCFKCGKNFRLVKKGKS